MEKPDVDHIEGLSPAIAIEQKSTSHTIPAPPSARLPKFMITCGCCTPAPAFPVAPDHGLDLDAQTVSQMVDQALALPEGERLMLLAPVVQERKGEHVKLLQELQAQGFVRAPGLTVK